MIIAAHVPRVGAEPKTCPALTVLYLLTTIAEATQIAQHPGLNSLENAKELHAFRSP